MLVSLSEMDAKIDGGAPAPIIFLDLHEFKISIIGSIRPVPDKAGPGPVTSRKPATLARAPWRARASKHQSELMLKRQIGRGTRVGQSK